MAALYCFSKCEKKIRQSGSVAGSTCCPKGEGDWPKSGVDVVAPNAEGWEAPKPALAVIRAQTIRRTGAQHARLYSGCIVHTREAKAHLGLLLAQSMVPLYIMVFTEVLLVHQYTGLPVWPVGIAASLFEPQMATT